MLEVSITRLPKHMVSPAQYFRSRLYYAVCMVLKMLNLNVENCIFSYGKDKANR